MKTLYLHGRFSRTLIEWALCSTTPSLSYSEYIPLLLSSLPPEGRSSYAADLYNHKYRGLEWDTKLYRNIGKGFMEAGRPLPVPIIPMGDDRRSPKMASIVTYAADFFTLLNDGLLFDGHDIKIISPALHAKLVPRYLEIFEDDDDSLAVVGPCFGIQKSDLNFDDDTGAKDQHSEMSPSEVILRMWNLLYHCERLCKTELECALLQGPDGAGGVKALFSNGLELVSKFPRCWPTNESGVMTGETAIQDLIRRASSLDFDTVEFAPVPQPGVVGGEEEEISTMMECDYCGGTPPKKLVCSHCHVAMYCGGECQQGDWKRHKPLCSRYQARYV
jgi:hypothetical protein